MSTQIHIKHPLRSNGSSQLSRLVKAISTSHFQLDERSSQDLINTAYEYARMLRYHGPERPAGDHWAGFWEIENLTYMAILAAMDTDQIRREYEKIDMEFGLALEGQPGKKGKKSNLEIEGQYFRRLLRYTRDTARKLERHYETLRVDIPLKDELLTLIRRDNDKRYEPDDIEGALQQLIAWHKAWDDRLRPEAYRAFLQEDHRWGVRNRDEYDCILPDESLSDRDEIRGLFLRFFNALLAIKARAQKLFDEESARLELPEDKESRPLAPHIALFISFLHLFRHAQDSLNEIPGRHLDFYYEQVLGLERRPATPDHAYLIFTLAKEFNEELIEQGAAVLAGKDKNGQPIKFKTLEQWKVTKAQVAELKSVYFDIEEQPNMVLASKVANSLDGLGASFVQGKPAAWRAFGDNKFFAKFNPDLVMEDIGFAISSPQLILKEGKRRVKIEMNIPDGFSLSSGDVSAFSIRLSNAESGWSEPLFYDKTLAQWDTRLAPLASTPIPRAAYSANIDAAKKTLTFLITLPESFPAVEKPEGITHKFRFPVVRIAMNQGHAGFVQNYQALKAAGLVDLNAPPAKPFAVKISAWVTGIRKNITLQNDFGTFDGTERFYPFGPLPERDAKFYLGSEEVFQKTLNDISIDFDWVDIPVTGKGVDAIPQDLREYYAAYSGLGNLSAALKVFLLDGANFQNPFPEPEEEEDEDGDDDQEGDEGVGDEGDVLLIIDDVKDTEAIPGIDPIINTELNNITLFDDTTGKTLYRPRIDLTSLKFERDVNIASELRFTPSVRRGFMLFQFKGNLLIDEYQKELMLAAKELDSTAIDNRTTSLLASRDNKLAAINRAIEAVKAALDGASSEALTAQQIKDLSLTELARIKEQADTVLPTLTNIPVSSEIPNPPITFATNGVSLSYFSVQEMEDEIDSILHIEPFSHFKKLESFNGASLADAYLPHEGFASKGGALDWATGNLYIGIENLVPGDLLSLLFSVQDASETDPEILPPPIIWSYLGANNQWQLLRPELIIEDSTHGLTKTGLLRISTPIGMRRQNTLLNPDLHWIRASVLEDGKHKIKGFPSLLDIRAQAIEAAFVPEKLSYLNRLNEALPAGTISKLEFSRSAVKKIEQPFATFGGRNPESDPEEYRRRVSERLRHKDRAVTAWDYEHLLLEKYAQVAVAKCIPHTRYEASGEYTQPSELAPGFVTVAVVPDLQKRPNMVREEPRFSRGDLYEMRDFLLPKCNLFLQPIPADPNDASDEADHFLQVLNPQYEPVHIALSVWLKQGADQNLAMYQINEALRRHLAPWLYDAAQGPTFGREIRHSKLIQLVEEMDAVDVVKWLKVFQVVLPEGTKYPTSVNSEGLLVIDEDPLGSSLAPKVHTDTGWETYEVLTSVIRPSTARSVLTTAKEHQVIIIGGKKGDVLRNPAGAPSTPAEPIPVVAPRRVQAPPVAVPVQKQAVTSTSKATSKKLVADTAKAAPKSTPSTSKRK